MVAFVKHQPFVENVSEKKIDLSGTLKLLLSNAAPNAAHGQKSQITEIGTGNGYSAGGPSVTVSSSSQTSGTYKLVCADVTITASGGSIGPFRTATLYDDGATNDELIGSWDYGSSITLADGESITVDYDATNGVLTLA